MSKVERIKAEMSKLGQIYEPMSVAQAPSAGYYVYMVYNGEDIAQIGKGSADRLSKCMRGSLAKKHNKVFICALLEVLKGGSLNRYCYLPVESTDRATAVEGMLHSCLGVRTNRDGATAIAGITGVSIEDIHCQMWAMFLQTPTYASLSAQEKRMATELFETVTYATIEIRRTSGQIVPSCQGDNLEGNILMNVQKNHLANIFQRLTNSYLRYGKHKLPEAEYLKLLDQYAYEPKGRAFRIRNF